MSASVAPPGSQTVSSVWMSLSAAVSLYADGARARSGVMVPSGMANLQRGVTATAPRRAVAVGSCLGCGVRGRR